MAPYRVCLDIRPLIRPILAVDALVRPILRVRPDVRPHLARVRVAVLGAEAAYVALELGGPRDALAEFAVPHQTLGVVREELQTVDAGDVRVCGRPLSGLISKQNVHARGKFLYDTKKSFSSIHYSIVKKKNKRKLP